MKEIRQLSLDDLAAVRGGISPAKRAATIAARAAQEKALPGCLEKGERENSQQVVDQCLVSAGHDAFNKTFARVSKLRQ
jgi:hypothetical protein